MAPPRPPALFPRDWRSSGSIPRDRVLRIRDLTGSWSEKERLAALTRYGVIDTPPEDVFNELVRLAAAICEAPMALISFVDELRQWFKATVGLDQTETPRAVAVCAHAMIEPEIMIISDLREDPRFSHNPMVVGDPDLRFYAGARLETPEGIPLGTISVLDTKPRPEGLTEQQRVSLLALARQVMVELELRRARAEEVTERQKFTKLFDEAPVFLAVGSVPEYRFEYVNAAFLRLVGEASLTGKKLTEAFPEVAEQGVITRLDEVARSGLAFSGHDFPLRLDRFPETRYVNFIYQPIQDQDGHVATIMFIGSDVTEAHLVTERAQRLELQLRQAQHLNAMGTMAATLAHELNQPLAASANYLAAAKRVARVGRADERLVQSIELASQQVHRAGEVIRRVRGLLNKKGPTNRQIMSLNQVLDDVYKTLNATGVCEHVELEVQISEDAESVHADPIQVEQVLLNLIRNACQASESKTNARVSILSYLYQDDYVLIEVRDSGFGIAPELLTEIFTPFISSSSEGQGLGLSISRTIVEANGGQIWAENHVEGASFYFTLPRADI